MKKVTIDSKYSATGLTNLETIKNLPDFILGGIYHEADERVCKDEPFNNAEFPLEGELMQQYEEAIKNILEESFDAIMERNNHKVKWEEL